MQQQAQVTAGRTVVRIADGIPVPSVPQQHSTSAIASARNHTLEVRLLERMILGSYCEALLARGEARAARQRPTLQYAVEFKPQVVVQSSRGMLLYSVPGTRLRGWRAVRFRGAGEIALAAIGIEC